MVSGLGKSNIRTESIDKQNSESSIEDLAVDVTIKADVAVDCNATSRPSFMMQPVIKLILFMWR